MAAKARSAMIARAVFIQAGTIRRRSRGKSLARREGSSFWLTHSRQAKSPEPEAQSLAQSFADRVPRQNSIGHDLFGCEVCELAAPLENPSIDHDGIEV